MSDFLELFVSAAASGCVYGLVALSYLVIIRPTGIINFAVGEWAAVAVFAAFFFLTNKWIPLPWAAAVVLTVIFAGVVGWGTQRIAVRPLVERGAPILGPILALLGMLAIFRESISLIFGPDPHNLPAPFGLRQVALGPLAGTPRDFFIIAGTGVVFVGAWLFFERTVWGKAFEAVALNRKAAALMGINLRRVTVAAFIGGASIAGFAGVLYSLSAPRDFLMGLPLAVQGFSALVVGGVGRVEGALLGGMILALAEQITARYADQIGIPSGMSLGVPFLLMIVFLLVRPTGLLKPKEARA
jgi:branched-chain amino acid transport system permease protein